LLIDELWADAAVGIVGGEPTCCKSFLALDMAVAVAGGVAWLRRFAPKQSGRVLFFAAEDALHVVRERLVGIARARQLRARRPRRPPAARSRGPDRLRAIAA
jgi:RecA-family ATPase